MSESTVADSDPSQSFAAVSPEKDGDSGARIYGQPYGQMPLDLYIPPDALAIMLDAFEGPLDLLLYLIRKTNIDVLDIPMAPLTRQYLDYVDVMRTKNLELAADYLVMAAMLIEIKSRMLLPKTKGIPGEEVDDPRAELVRRLIEYEQMKAAAYKLDCLPQAERDFIWIDLLVEKTQIQVFPEVDLDDLSRAWKSILRHAKLHKHHKLQREELSVREHMTRILRVLQQADQNGVTFVDFITLFDINAGVSSVVVHFLAMLELAREQLINISQTEAFSPIYVRMAYISKHEGRINNVAELGEPKYA